MSAFSNRKSGQTARMDYIPPERDVLRRDLRAKPRVDIVDAEFEVVADLSGPKPFPVFNDNRARQRKAETPAGAVALKVAAKGVRQMESGLQNLSGRAFVALVFLVALSAAGVTASFALGPAGSSSSAPFQPFQISDVDTVLRQANGMDIVEVTGSISNVTGSARRLPAIELVSEEDGTSGRVAMISSDGRPMQPGQSARFSARFPHAGGKLPGLKFSITGLDAPNP